MKLCGSIASYGDYCITIFSLSQSEELEKLGLEMLPDMTEPNIFWSISQDFGPFIFLVVSSPLQIFATLYYQSEVTILRLSPVSFPLLLHCMYMLFKKCLPQQRSFSQRSSCLSGSLE
jgi:hypothetical protein